MSNQVKWFEVTGRDGEALRRFYGDLFGWQAQTNDAMPDYGMVEGADGGISGGIGGAQDGQGQALFYVEVDDVAGALDRAVSLGGSKCLEPTQVPEGPEIAVFADPEGHAVGLFKMG